jgi:hypothetical protein
MEKTLEHKNIGNNSLNITLVTQQLRESADKWDCMKLKHFCAAKETSILVMRQHTEQEKNLCQLFIWQGINNQNVQGAQKN